VNKLDRSRVMRFAEAHASIPSGERSAGVWQRGSLDVVFALPVPPKEQAPHAQDEIYIIVRGRGVLFHDGKRDSFEPGDLLFVAAGTEHQFEDVTEDLALWRVFYGPPGGDTLAIENLNSEPLPLRQMPKNPEGR
jgi:mannose-6-phosphate isomerase-like protein (cupin superfamily)